jgi:predicted CoA-binding protein
MPDPNIRRILEQYKTVAIVGLSDKPFRDSYRIAVYLLEHGYKAIPVNPTIDEVLGLKAYPHLSSIPETVEIVNIFRRAEFIGPIVDEAIKIGAKVIWMQLGVANQDAAGKARQAGLEVVMNRCIKVEHMTHLS